MTKLSIHLEKMIFKAKRFLKKEYNKIIYIVKFLMMKTKQTVLVRLHISKCDIEN